MTLLTTTFVLFNSAAIHDRKEARPRETTMEKLNAKPYWCFSIGGGGGVLDGGTVLFGRWLESRENRQQGLELTQKERKI